MYGHRLGDLEQALPFDYIIIDEVHERNQATDLLMAVLMQAYSQNGVSAEDRVPLDRLPRLVIMSATLNANQFQGVSCIV